MKYLYSAWLICVSLLAVCYCGRTEAAEWRLLEPSEVIIRGEQYEVLRDPYLREYDKQWTYGAGLGVKLDVFSYGAWRLYYDPTLSFRSTTSQIRQGGLEFQTGIFMPVTDEMSVDIFKYHESLHGLEANETTPDGKSTSRHYPLIESYGMELKWRLK